MATVIQLHQQMPESLYKLLRREQFAEHDRVNRPTDDEFRAARQAKQKAALNLQPPCRHGVPIRNCPKCAPIGQWDGPQAA